MVIRNLYAFFTLFLPFGLFSQEPSVIISRADHQLQNKTRTISDVLGDSTLMYLHSLTPFREVIRKNATAEPITIVAPGEPGIKIVVNGTVTNQSGTPTPGLLVYFYHTGDNGWYSDTAVHILGNEGDHRHARLFGYVKTNAAGKFQIITIKPKGYPKSDLAAHIHVQMWKADGTPLFGVPGELQFDDDVRMTEQRRQRSLAAGFLIGKNRGTKENPVYDYQVITTGN